MAQQPPSPCVAICVMDPATCWCKGCHRSIEEITGWIGYSAEQKLAVLRRLEQRRITSEPAAAPRR